MRNCERSLHRQVEKWFAPTAIYPVRVTRFGRTVVDRTPFVCVASLRDNGMMSLIFFRHSDGAWHVYPPSAAAPTSMLAAVA